MSHEAIVTNVFETKAGTFKVRWRENGKNCQRTFKRKIDAIELQTKLFKGNPAPKKVRPIFFEEFVAIWTQRHCNVNIEGSTAEDYRIKMGKNILPYFKCKTLASIDEDDVIKFKEWLIGVRGLKPRTVGNQIRLLKLVFNCACRWRDENKNPYLLSSPAVNVREPKKPEPDFNFWTIGEIRTFLEYVQKHAPDWVSEVALLAIATGMRRGELHQLKADCFDFENRIVTVKRSFSFATRKEQHTKAKRIRRIPMNAEVYNKFYKYKDLPAEKRVFEGVNIEHFHRHLRKWCKRAGASVVTLHDLRDTFASSLVKAGKKIKVIQYLMGHIDIKVTEKYMHLDPSDVEGSTECLLTGVAA